jgi:hypothetical protein
MIRLMRPNEGYEKGPQTHEYRNPKHTHYETNVVLL